jgi:very-short-patch-repair endonuclease
VSELEKPVFRKRNTARSRELRRSASPQERRLWEQLRAGQLDGHRFTKQFQIGDYFADIACRAQKLVIEVDGWSHDSRQEYDMRRDQFLRLQGYRILRFTNDDVMTNLDGVVTMIRQALAAAPSPNPSRKQEGS